MNFSYGNEFDVQTPKKTASETLIGKGSPTDKSPFTKDDPYEGPFFLGDPNTGKGSLMFEIVDSIVHGTPPGDSFSFGDESNEEIARNRAVKAYRDAVVGGGYDLFGTPGDRGIRYYDFDDYRKMQDLTPYSEMESPPDVNVDIYKQRPYIVKQGGVDLVGVTDPETGKFRPLTFNDAEQAKISGIVGPVNPSEDEGVDNGDGGGGDGDSGGGGDEKPIPVPVYDLVKPTPYVTPLPPDFDSGFTGITPPNQVTTQIPQTSMITPPTSQYTASMLSEATPTLSSEQLMGLGTDEEQSLADLLALLDNNTSVG